MEQYARAARHGLAASAGSRRRGCGKPCPARWPAVVLPKIVPDVNTHCPQVVSKALAAALHRTGTAKTPGCTERLLPVKLRGGAPKEPRDGPAGFRVVRFWQPPARGNALKTRADRAGTAIGTDNARGFVALSHCMDDGVSNVRVPRGLRQGTSAVSSFDGQCRAGCAAAMGKISVKGGLGVERRGWPALLATPKRDMSGRRCSLALGEWDEMVSGTSVRLAMSTPASGASGATMVVQRACHYALTTFVSSAQVARTAAATAASDSACPAPSAATEVRGVRVEGSSTAPSDVAVLCALKHSNAQACGGCSGARAGSSPTHCPDGRPDSGSRRAPNRVTTFNPLARRRSCGGIGIRFGAGCRKPELPAVIPFNPVRTSSNDQPGIL